LFPPPVEEPNLRPNPLVHPFGPGVLSAIRVAVTAPIEFAVPFALTHSPTLSALAVLRTTSVAVVAGLVVTVTVVAWPERVEVRRIVEPETVTTLPEVAAANARGVLPGENVLPDRGAPAGRPDCPVPPGADPGPPPAPPKVHVALVVEVMAMVAAVSAVRVAAGAGVASVLVETAEIAVMQSPGLIALRGTFRLAVKVVVGV